MTVTTAPTFRCEAHVWTETGRIDHTLDGRPYEWLACSKCGAPGFRRLPSQAVHVWHLADLHKV